MRDETGWIEKKGKLPFGKGIGVSCGFFISGSALPIHKTRTPQSTVHLQIDVDGGITAHSQGAEIGQGSDTVNQRVHREPQGKAYPTQAMGWAAVLMCMTSCITVTCVLVVIMLLALLSTEIVLMKMK